MKTPGRPGSPTGFSVARLIIPGALALAVAGALAAHPTAAVKRHTVSMEGMAFKPARLTVAVGDTVVWTNKDIVPHTAAAPGPQGWDTGELSQGQSGQYVPTRKGEVKYGCGLHPAMEGTLVVQ